MPSFTQTSGPGDSRLGASDESSSELTVGLPSTGILFGADLVERLNGCIGKAAWERNPETHRPVIYEIVRAELKDDKILLRVKTITAGWGRFAPDSPLAVSDTPRRQAVSPIEREGRPEDTSTIDDGDYTHHFTPGFGFHERNGGILEVVGFASHLRIDSKSTPEDIKALYEAGNLEY